MSANVFLRLAQTATRAIPDSKSATKNSTHDCGDIELDLFAHSSSSTQAAVTETHSPVFFELTKNQKDYHKILAADCVTMVEEKLNRSVVGEHPARLHDTKKNIVEGLMPGVSEPTIPAHITEILSRLRTAIQFLNDPCEYNTIEGRQHKRFLLQALSDPTLGKDDPFRKLIVKELGMNETTYSKFAEECKEEGLGFFPLAEGYCSLAQEWIPVCSRIC